MRCFLRLGKIFLLILGLLIASFSVWYLLHKNPNKVLNKILNDPLANYRSIKSKQLSEKEFLTLSNKVKNKNPPAWFFEAIKDDFSNITKLPITKKGIDETFAEGLYLRIKIIDNKVYIPSSPYVLSYRDKEMLKTFLALTKKVNLPNVDFLLYCNDLLTSDTSQIKAPIMVFSLNKNRNKNRILIPDALTLKYWPELYFSVLEINQEIKWKDKINKAFWRGVDTGIIDGQDKTIDNFHLYPRAKLVEFSNAHPHLLDAKFVLMQEMDKRYKAKFEQKYKLAKNATKKEHLEYKIQITIDGNTSTYPGYLWRLLSNSVTFKDDSNDIQWFYRIFKPNIHYIPFKRDMSDLEEKIEWVKNHDEEARQISENASKLVQENLKPTDLYWYIIVLLEEYSKLQSFKPEYDSSLILVEELLKIKNHEFK